jgi:hypothetical protein
LNERSEDDPQSQGAKRQKRLVYHQLERIAFASHAPAKPQAESDVERPVPIAVWHPLHEEPLPSGSLIHERSGAPEISRRERPELTVHHCTGRRTRLAVRPAAPHVDIMPRQRHPFRNRGREVGDAPDLGWIFAGDEMILSRSAHLGS